MEPTYADSCSDMAQPCDMDLWVMKWRSAWPIFHGPVILSYILKTIWCMYIILWDLTFDLKINVGHCDLYSMVQWFCLISWRLFDVWTILFGIMSQYHHHHHIHFRALFSSTEGWAFWQVFLEGVLSTQNDSEGQQNPYLASFCHS